VSDLADWDGGIAEWGASSAVSRSGRQCSVDPAWFAVGAVVVSVAIPVVFRVDAPHVGSQSGCVGVFECVESRIGSVLGGWSWGNDCDRRRGDRSLAIVIAVVVYLRALSELFFPVATLTPIGAVFGVDPVIRTRVVVDQAAPVAAV